MASFTLVANDESQQDTSRQIPRLNDHLVWAERTSAGQRLLSCLENKPTVHAQKRRIKLMECTRWLIWTWTELIERLVQLQVFDMWFWIKSFERLLFFYTARGLRWYESAWSDLFYLHLWNKMMYLMLLSSIRSDSCVDFIYRLNQNVAKNLLRTNQLWKCTSQNRSY